MTGRFVGLCHDTGRKNSEKQKQDGQRLDGAVHIGIVG
jgi:hypothetical protein